MSICWVRCHEQKRFPLIKRYRSLFWQLLTWQKKNKKTTASSLPTIQLTSCCHFNVYTFIVFAKITYFDSTPQANMFSCHAAHIPHLKKGVCVSFQSGDQTYLGGVVVTIIDKHLWLLHLKSSKDIAVTLYIISLLVVNLKIRETFQCVLAIPLTKSPQVRAAPFNQINSKSHLKKINVTQAFFLVLITIPVIINPLSLVGLVQNAWSNLTNHVSKVGVHPLGGNILIKKSETWDSTQGYFRK